MIEKLIGFFITKDPDGKTVLNMKHGSIAVYLLFLLSAWTIPHSFLYIYMLTYWRTGVGMLVFSTVTVLLIGISASVLMFLILKKHRKELVFDPIVTAVILSLANYCICECMISRTAMKNSILVTLNGLLLYFIVFAAGAVILKNPKIWFCIATAFSGAFTVLQHYVLKFRDSPILASDIRNISNALEIKGEYSFTLSLPVAAAVIMTALLLTALIFMRFKVIGIKPRAALLVSTGALTAFSVSMASRLFTIQNGVLPFSLSNSSYNIGSLNMIYYDILMNNIRMPEGYSKEDTERLLSQYSSEKEDVGTPIVIGILNESFADHTHLAEFSSNKDALSVWRSLSEDTVKGYVTVSPYGSGTCNSEYEFLTGNSMHYLPLGVGVYGKYFSTHKETLVDTFNTYGFDTVGISPVYSSLWNVGNVYEVMGFDRTYFLGQDEIPLDPGAHNDSEFYDRLTEIADSRDKSRGLFIWAATMENHGGYDEPKADSGIILEEPYDQYAENYLNTVCDSDQATQKLIDHFRDYDEQVIIVMFGDHYPSLPEFDKALLAKRSGLSELEKNALKHQTPFFIWSNRDIEEAELQEISLNYLSDLVFKAAGIPLTPMQQELEHIRESLPIICEWGTMTADGQWYARGEALPDKYKDIYNEYAGVCYYRMEDQF